MPFSASASPFLGITKEVMMQMPPIDTRVPAAMSTPPTGPQILMKASCTGTVLSARDAPITPMHTASSRK